MWNRRRRVKQRSSVGRGLKAVKISAKNNKTLTAVLITWVLTQLAGSLTKALPDLNPWISKMYLAVLSLNPGATGNGIEQLLYFNLLFWPVAGIVLMIRGVAQYYIKKRKQIVEIEEPFVLYKEELAAAIEAIDQGGDAEEEIVALLLLIAETVAVNLGLRKKDYRMYFVVPKPIDQDKQSKKKRGLLSGVRIGRQFEMVGKSVSHSDFEKMTEMDSMNVETFLGVDVTEVTSFANMATQGAHALLFIRNPGKHLRLGLYVAVLKENPDLDAYEETFGRVAQIVAILGFIDAISEFVVNYQ